MQAVLEVGDLIVFNQSYGYTKKPEDWGIVTRVSPKSATVYWFSDDEITIERRIADTSNHSRKIA